jgi:hypothetical protein
MIGGGVKLVGKKNLILDIEIRRRAPKGAICVCQGFMIGSDEINQRSSSVFCLSEIVLHDLLDCW